MLNLSRRFIKYFFLICLYLLRAFIVLLFPSRYRSSGWRKTKIDKKIFYHRQPKPAWVRKEVIRLKALMPEAGCRLIAHTFNRRFARSRQMTVSKTFVNEIIRKYKYQIQVLRRKIKNRIPKPVPRNLIWGIDISGKTDTQGDLNHILGILEHKSRLSLGLAVLKDKASITILRYLLDAVERYGKPRLLRTDNEPVFTSWLFKLGLWFMGISHQRIDACCPWQNGRIERFFGTLKEKLNQWQVSSLEQLNGALVQFRFWYNHVRPHQNLNGRTPSEVWEGIDVFSGRPKHEYWFEAWDG